MTRQPGMAELGVGAGEEVLVEDRNEGHGEEDGGEKSKSKNKYGHEAGGMIDD
ncbi:hypothetical protein AB0J47_17930 [Nocardia sp. NPDC049737]|uniref:hypothetical protein n=1 Tax=Nocardia sp. NPDC049737 TaxID=3154358 RepID=UPI003428180A